LFELTDQKVWTKAVKDTTGLRQYYENNKYNYTWPDRAEISVFTCENADYSKKVREMIAKGDMEHPAIESELNTDGKQHVELDGGTYSEEDRPLLGQFNWKKDKINATDLTVNGKPVVICVNKFLPSGPKKLTEARGVITSDYQTYLEKSWIENLRKDHQIQINKDESSTFNVEASDVLMFPKHIPFEVLDGEVTIKTFKTGNFPVLGDGDTKFKVEVTFADNYSIDVYANSEQEAIDFAYDTPMSYWVHHWEEDQELERFTTTRRTRWGKKMLRIEKND
jgi:hypothetical protein